MPYTCVQEKGRYYVHKKNADGSAGERLKSSGAHPSRRACVRQMRAIAISEGRSEGKAWARDLPRPKSKQDKRKGSGR